MPAPSPLSGSAPEAPRWSRLRSAVRALTTMSLLGTPVMVATKATPQASRSKAGSYRPVAAGTAENSVMSAPQRHHRPAPAGREDAVGAGVEVGGTSLAHLAARIGHLRHGGVLPGDRRYPRRHGPPPAARPRDRDRDRHCCRRRGPAGRRAADLPGQHGRRGPGRPDPDRRAVVRDSAGGTRGPTSAALARRPDAPGRRRRRHPAPGRGPRHGRPAGGRPGDPRRTSAWTTPGSPPPTSRSCPPRAPGSGCSCPSRSTWPARKCVRLAVNRVDVSLDAQPRILRTAKVLRSKPCVPPANIQHASGKLVRDHRHQRLCHPRRPRLSRHRQPRAPRAARLGPADRRRAGSPSGSARAIATARASRWTAWAGSGRPSTVPGAATS